MNIEDIYRKSIEQHSVISLIDKLGHIRTVEPHILYEDGKGEKKLGFYFLNGFDGAKHAEPHWDSMKLSEFEDAQITRDHFQKRKDFDPFNAKYHDVLEYVK